MAGTPKTMKDFKKVSNTNPSNNPILHQKQMNQHQPQQPITPQNKVDKRGPVAPIPMEQVLGVNSISEETQPIQQSPKQSVDFEYGAPGFREQAVFGNNNAFSTQPPQSKQDDFPKPDFIKDTNNYEEIARTTMNQMPQSMNTITQQSVQQQKTNSYAHVPFMQQTKSQPQKSNIATRVAEAEQEINALVGNTELFLENITKMKLEIINARTVEELSNIMVAAREILQNIPDGFIDSETCRKIRICFSHLEKTKKQLLETELGLLKLASIGDSEELEKVYMEVPASASTDAIYEVRTFELNLLERLPDIREEMMKERVLSAYQQ